MKDSVIFNQASIETQYVSTLDEIWTTTPRLFKMYPKIVGQEN